MKTTTAKPKVSIEAMGEAAAKACEAKAAAAIDAKWKAHWENLAKQYRQLATRCCDAEAQMTSTQTVYRDFEGWKTSYTGKEYRARRGGRVQMQAILPVAVPAAHVDYFGRFFH